MQNLFKKSLVLTLLVMIGGAILPSPAQAITPAVCVYDQPRQITSSTIETYSQWLKRQKLQLSNNACFADSKALAKMYDSLSKKVILENQSKDKNEFNKRFDSCTKGIGSALNPSTWVTSLKCLFTVSFFPTSDVLKNKINQLIGDVKSHQPFSYIPIGLSIVTNVGSNWGKISCNSGEGALPFLVKVPSMTQPWKFVIPCNPPSPLRIFRDLMELAIYIGFAFWLMVKGKYILEGQIERSR